MSWALDGLALQIKEIKLLEGDNEMENLSFSFEIFQGKLSIFKYEWTKSLGIDVILRNWQRFEVILRTHYKQ